MNYRNTLKSKVNQEKRCVFNKLEFLLKINGVQVVAGSNPAVPTRKSNEKGQLGISLFCPFSLITCLGYFWELSVTPYPLLFAFSIHFQDLIAYLPHLFLTALLGGGIAWWSKGKNDP